MSRARVLTVLCLVGVMLLGSLGPAQAAPPIPSSFYGEVHFIGGDGGPAAGDTIEAHVPGVDGPVAAAQLQTHESNLVYALNVPGDDPDAPAKDGGLEDDRVTFQIGGRIVGRGTWKSGTNVRLDIHPPKADAGGPYAALAGASISLSGSAQDWYTGDTFTYAWDLDGDGEYDDSYSQNPSHQFTGPGVKAVGLKVTDSQGGQGTATATVCVVQLGGLTGQTYDGSAKPITVDGVAAPYTYAVTYDGGATAPKDAGTYAVVGTIKHDGTEVATFDASLVIGKRPITVTADGQTKVYGADDPALTYKISAGTLVGDDSLTGALGRVAGEDVGEYAINQGTLTAGGNYALTFAGARLTITKRPLTVTADSKTKVYGAADPTLTYSITAGSLAYSDTFSGALDRVSGEDIGTYAIQRGTLAPNQNYELTFVEGTLTITALKHSIALVEGWNLISFNLHPVDTGIEAVLNGISGQYDLVYAWDATGGRAGAGHWMKHAPGGIGNTLTDLDKDMGFWVHMTAAATLDVYGSYAATTDIALSTASGGWNLAGYPSQSASALPAALASLGSDYALVYAYRAADTADPWKLYEPAAPSYANDLTELAPGWGYWIRVTANRTWSVDY